MTLPDDHVLTACASATASWDVLAFIGSLNVGGCERHLATVYPRLAASGLKVGIVTFRRGGPLEDEVRANGVDVLCLDRRVLRTTIFGVDLQPSRWLSRAHHLTISPGFCALAALVSRISFCRAPTFSVGFGALIARHSNVVMSRRSLNDYQAGTPDIVAN